MNKMVPDPGSWEEYVETFKAGKGERKETEVHASVFTLPHIREAWFLLSDWAARGSGRTQVLPRQGYCSGVTVQRSQ